ncbi:MAG: sigma-54 dependent transcriptional regulator [Candidatus Omnitrophica bacterium]|nr:sigma-54 dependent transcriptional regulator [Candidatus Omnitrophota bacterium]
MKEKILLVDDEELIRITLKDILEKEGYEVLVAEDGKNGFQKFQEEKPILVLLDIKMPGLDGISLLQKIKNTCPETIVIMITGYGTIPGAVQAMKLGAYDYITKPFLPEEIIELVKRAVEFYRLKEENKFLKEKLKSRWKLEGLIGQNVKMQEIYQLIETVAKTNATVLIQGETGTGKELVACAIHNLSNRKNKPLVKVSCAGLPETLLESELFGHEKGAFTDALTRKIGRFELADKGTLFLDDVDDMSPTIQVKLLRVLQDRKFERVGGTETIQVDIRLIAASKKDLWELVKEGKFRDDLYYRLNVISISMPPLRERKDDIPLLVNHFLELYCKKHNKKVNISQDTISILQEYNWPGNVRELENVIERVVVLSDKSELGPNDFSFIKEIKTFPQGIREIIKETEKEHIIKVLKQTKGKKEEAAKILGISRKTLWQKIKEYGIE